MSARKILVIGELNVDLILNNIEGFPKIGTEIVAESMNFTLGSSSAITASNISAMGIDTSFCGMIGDDDFGNFILKELELKNVKTDFIMRSENHKTGMTVIMNYDQDRANVTYCGAMNALSIDKIPWNNINDFNHFHFANYFLQPGVQKDIAQVFNRAKDAGLTTSLDLQWDPDSKWNFDYKSCLPFVDIFLPNIAELLALTKKENVEDALEELMSYANIIALKMGEKGGRVCSKDADFVVEPFINKNFKDAIGAGDSFNAGFIQKFIEGASLEECLQNANLIGSLSTTEAGGTAAFSSKEAIEVKKKQILNNEL